MNLTFKSIDIERFRSFSDKATFSFDSAGYGLYFLKGKNQFSSALGSNGAGKSSIVDALLWCLYGKTVAGLRNPDIIPWSGKGTTQVQVNIRVDKTVHAIRRTAGPNLLTIDGAEAGQEYVDKLIGIPFEIIPYTIILGQKQPLFFDLTASEKLKLFSEVLNLERWELRSNHASELAKSLESEIGSKQIELEACLNAHSQAISDFDSLKLQSTEWEAKRAEQLANAEETKKLLQKQITGVQNERDSADLLLDRALTELKAFEPIFTKLNKEEKDLSIQIYGAENQRTQIITRIGGWIEQKAAFKNKKCPTCNQPVHDAKERVKELEEKISGNEVEAAVLDKKYKKNLKELEGIVKAKDLHDEAKAKFEHDAGEARDVLDRLLPKIANWEAEIKALEKQLQTDEANNNPYTEQLQTLRRRRDINKANSEQAQKSIKTKTEYSERVKFWIKGFKDIKLLQVEEILQELEIVTNSMCEESGLVHWQIKYDIERETKAKTIARGLNITVLSPANKTAVKWEVWSGGEAQRLRLIGTAALSSVLLNHVGISTNLEIYDEPTIGLGKEGVYDLVEMLAQRAKTTKKNILLIDHHAIESVHFTQTILVTKDKHGSFLEIV